MNPGYRVLDNLYTWIIEDARIWRRHHEVLEDLQQSIIQDTIAKRSKVKELDTLLNPKPLGPRKVWEAVKPFHIQHWDWFITICIFLFLAHIFICHYFSVLPMGSQHFSMPHLESQYFLGGVVLVPCILRICFKNSVYVYVYISLYNEDGVLK